MWETQETEPLERPGLLWPGQGKDVRWALVLALWCLGFSSHCAMCHCRCLEAKLSPIWGPQPTTRYLRPSFKYSCLLTQPSPNGLPGAPASQELALQGFSQAWSFPQTSQERVPAGPAVARLQAGAQALAAWLAEGSAGGSAWRQSPGARGLRRAARTALERR